MNAELIAQDKVIRGDGRIIEVVIWLVPNPVLPCSHPFKYRLYFGLGSQCHVRYDNERGKGDHRHIGGREEIYNFESIDKLVADFERDIQDWSST